MIAQLMFKGIHGMQPAEGHPYYTAPDLAKQVRMFWERYDVLTKRKTKHINKLLLGRKAAVQMEKRGCASTVRPWHPATPNVCDWARHEPHILHQLNTTEQDLELLVAKMAAILAGHKTSVYAKNCRFAAEYLGKEYKATVWVAVQHICECWRCQSKG